MDDVDINVVICLLKFQAQQSAVVIRWQQPSKLEWRNSIEGYIEMLRSSFGYRSTIVLKLEFWSYQKICAKLNSHTFIKILLIFVLSWTLALKINHIDRWVKIFRRFDLYVIYNLRSLLLGAFFLAYHRNQSQHNAEWLCCPISPLSPCSIWNALDTLVVVQFQTAG